MKASSSSSAKAHRRLRQTRGRDEAFGLGRMGTRPEFGLGFIAGGDQIPAGTALANDI